MRSVFVLVTIESDCTGQCGYIEFAQLACKSIYSYDNPLPAFSTKELAEDFIKNNQLYRHEALQLEVYTGEN